MQWLQTLDVELFRWINQDLANPAFDRLMPFVSGNALSFALLYVLVGLAALLLLWKGGSRGLVFLLMLILALAIGDGLICNTIKHAVARQRPFLVLSDVHCLLGKGGSGSMPSSHAANWFAASLVAFVYYRRSAWFMLPAALLVSFSRVYNGVHYPSDVLAGAILGAGYAAAIVWSLHSLWQWAGQKWFPLWWQAFPSLLDPTLRPTPSEEEDEPMPPPRGTPRSALRARHATLDEHWLRLGYIAIAVLLLARLAYIAGGTIQLCEDEAYQWLWSKHLALSYYSKPPLIAYTQFLGTALWGDNAFGVRFFSPFCAAIVSLSLLRFLAREVNARAGFFLLLLITATPLLSIGGVLLTVDPLSVVFWTAAMLAGWRAVQPSSTHRDWLWVGLWMGLGFLSKYTALFQWLCWVVFFALWRPARQQLRRPGPYLALVVNLLCGLPVLLWNFQHDWVTVRHLADDAGAGAGWEHPVKYPAEFLGSEFGLLNPIFFVAMLWAAFAFWRRGRHNPRLLYFFSMGAPLFVVYLAHSFHSRVLPNWIAPAVLPLFCLMTVYWDARWRLGVTRLKGWLTAGLLLGLALVLFAHNTDVWRRTLPVRRAVATVLPNLPSPWPDVLTGEYLPVKLDPLHRVRVWSDVAQAAGRARSDLLSEGKPVFIITHHYGIAGLISFYLPEARAVAASDSPLVYGRSTARPENQFYFWPGYSQRKGENAIYVLELPRAHPDAQSPPERLVTEFESVTSLGVHQVLYHGNLCRPIQLFACRNLREHPIETTP